jgi:hypothetical protein
MPSIFVFLCVGRTWGLTEPGYWQDRATPDQPADRWSSPRIMDSAGAEPVLPLRPLQAHMLGDGGDPDRATDVFGSCPLAKELALFAAMTTHP